MNKAYIIAFAVIGVALGVTLWSFSSGLTPYVTVQSARKSGAPVQIRGLILRDQEHPVVRDPRRKALRFWIEDANKEKIEIVYYGAKPDAFDSAPGTAAHGYVRQENGHDIFVSDNLIVQCPSKYNDEKSVYKRAASAGK